MQPIKNGRHSVSAALFLQESREKLAITPDLIPCSGFVHTPAGAVRRSGGDVMFLSSISLTGPNSVLDWGLWLVLIALVVWYLWRLFGRKGK